MRALRERDAGLRVAALARLVAAAAILFALLLFASSARATPLGALFAGRADAPSRPIQPSAARFEQRFEQRLEQRSSDRNAEPTCALLADGRPDRTARLEEHSRGTSPTLGARRSSAEPRADDPARRSPTKLAALPCPPSRQPSRPSIAPSPCLAASPRATERAPRRRSSFIGLGPLAPRGPPIS